MAGKGSKPRPMSIPESQFNENWDKIFGKKDKTDQPTTDTVQNVNIHDIWEFAKQHSDRHADGYRKDAFAYVEWWINEYNKTKEIL